MRFKLIVGIVMIIMPFVVFLFYNNYYAMNVVRIQVSQSEYNHLTNQIEHIDNKMVDLKHYLLKIAVGDYSSDYAYPELYSLGMFPEDSGQYFFTKQRIMNQFKADIDAYEGVHTLFAYSLAKEDLIVLHSDKKMQLELNESLSRYLKEQKDRDFDSWIVVTLADKPYLMKVFKGITQDVYVGALAEADKLMAMVNDFGREAALFTRKGELLADRAEWTESGAGGLAGFLSSEERFTSIRSPDDRSSYLTIKGSFKELPLQLLIFIPERILLEHLPYFQRVILLVPVVAAVIAIGCLLFVRKVILVPLNDIIKGMRRITMGNLDIRLDPTKTTEFRFMIESFNQMASEIQSLKIDVYEKMLQVKEAELKHLQAQINPHFYMNSLNIVHSLASLQEHELIQKMAKHLQDYFRFTMQNHRKSVSFSEELNHLQNYLEIQKLRFPNKLTFDIAADAAYMNCRIPPLTVQPFAENCVIHGMKKGKDMLLIRIAVRPDPVDPERFVTVDITDNGNGFPEERLAELQAMQRAGDVERNEHLGIWNVCRRLKMMFNEPVETTLGNMPEQGAKVTLRIPILRQKHGEAFDV
jgi:two-component system sensor histidine kinase YesM